MLAGGHCQELSTASTRWGSDSTEHAFRLGASRALCSDKEAPQTEYILNSRTSQRGGTFVRSVAMAFEGGRGWPDASTLSIAAHRSSSRRLWDSDWLDSVM